MLPPLAWSEGQMEMKSDDTVSVDLWHDQRQTRPSKHGLEEQIESMRG